MMCAVVSKEAVLKIKIRERWCAMSDIIFPLWFGGTLGAWEEEELQ